MRLLREIMFLCTTATTFLFFCFFSLMGLFGLEWSFLQNMFIPPQCAFYACSERTSDLCFLTIWYMCNHSSKSCINNRIVGLVRPHQPTVSTPLQLLTLTAVSATLLYIQHLKKCVKCQLKASFKLFIHEHVAWLENMWHQHTQFEPLQHLTQRLPLHSEKERSHKDREEARKY